MSEVDQMAEMVKRLTRGVTSFAEDMRSQDIHVGMPRDGVVRCVNCGDAWPCASSSGPVGPEETP